MIALLGAIASLVSVLATGTIALLTLRQASVNSRAQRSQQYLFSILPRRLDALESTWRMIFELEAGIKLSQDRLSQLVEFSIWLPAKLRDELIRSAARPDTITTERVSVIRDELLKSSGAPLIDVLQAKLLDVSPDSQS
jgi:hypothetical protein